MPENWSSTKFQMCVLGIGLCVLWQAMGWEKDLLWTALGFVGIYSAANVGDKVANKMK